MNNSIQHIKAVIFDMDGLLLDTERIAMNTFMASCTECGFEPKEDIYLQCVGSNRAKTQQILMEGYGPTFPFQAINNLWDQKYLASINSDIPLKQGVEAIFGLLSDTALKIGLATSTNHAVALKKLEKVKLDGYFEVIVGGDQVTQGKPHPEVYQKVADILNVSPEYCLALEDSDNGVKAAYHAKMQVIQIPDLKEPSEEVKSLGHLILPSLTEASKLIANSLESRLGVA